MSFRPLEPTRQLPANPVNTLKRSNPENDKDAFVRAAVRPRVMFTPPPSDGAAPSSDDTGFKVPAIPQRIRFMTPSSSTVAASSSPAPMSSPNAPPQKRSSSNQSNGSKQKIDGEVIPVVMETGYTYVFGRHRHRDTLVESTSTLPPSISSRLSPVSKPVRTIFLPRQASHASRLHATVEYVSTQDELRIVVSGQNGLKVVSKSMKRRVSNGQTVTVEREDQIKLDFYGCTVLLRFPTLAQKDTMALFSPNSSPVSRPICDSLPPSSPPIGPISEHDEDDDEDERKAINRASSPLSPIPDKPMSLTDIDLVVKSEMLEQVNAQPSSPRPKSRTISPVKEMVMPVPADIDLAALIASTVVYSGSSKLSLPDLVKHILEVCTKRRNGLECC